MTLIASSPNIQNCLQAKTDAESTFREQLSLSSLPDEEDNQQAIEEYCFGNVAVQNLGYGDVTDAVPYFGNVSIENSTDVHIGDKNVYHGAVTIKQIVYTNGPAAISKDGDDAENDDGYRTDGAPVHRKVADGPQQNAIPNNPDSELGKGILWLRNVSKRRRCEIGIFLLILVMFLIGLTTILVVRHTPGKPVQPFNTGEQDSIQPIDYNPDITTKSQRNNTKLRITSRDAWVAQPPTHPINDLVTPVPYVVVHHTATENCSSHAQCVFRVRFLQTFDIESKGLYDIAFNFLVGGDGAIYEGRGWTVEGGHSDEYDSKSIGIAFIGTFIHSKPSEIQILICQRLIEKGIEQRFIDKNYKLMAYKRLAENSGTALFEEIKTWQHWIGPT